VPRVSIDGGPCQEPLDGAAHVPFHDPRRAVVDLEAAEQRRPSAHREAVGHWTAPRIVRGRVAATPHPVPPRRGLARALYFATHSCAVGSGLLPLRGRQGCGFETGTWHSRDPGEFLEFWRRAGNNAGALRIYIVSSVRL